ncbi:MAG: hypothetical protein SCK70_03940 [bacterium]|nr:hypothetical protein [bacterium]
MSRKHVRKLTVLLMLLSFLPSSFSVCSIEHCHFDAPSHSHFDDEFSSDPLLSPTDHFHGAKHEHHDTEKNAPQKIHCHATTLSFTFPKPDLPKTWNEFEAFYCIENQWFKNHISTPQDRPPITVL